MKLEVWGDCFELLHLFLVKAEEGQNLPLQFITRLCDDIPMEGIMLNLLHLDKLNHSISIPSDVFTIQQPSLLNWDNLICSRVQQQYPACEFCDVVYIGEMIFFEFDIALVFIIKHAGEGAYGTLQDSCLDFVFSCVDCYRISTEAKPPKDDLISWSIQPRKN